MVNEAQFIALLEKYMKGIISEQEMKTLTSLIENPSQYHYLRPALLRIWTNDKEPDSVNLGSKEANQILNKIHHLINLDEENKIILHSGIAKAINLFSKIAAILILPLIIAGIWYFIDSRSTYGDLNESEWVSISSSMGSKIKTILPDSTIIWQNAGSTVKYPRNYTKKNRQVILSGEAFFAVHSDRLYPFYVRTDHLQVKVTGTRFNVSSYNDDKSTTVVLEEGKIGIQNLSNPSHYYLKPNMCFSLDNLNNKAIVKHVDINKYISWKDGKLIFRNDPLSDVCTRLKRLYNAEIELSDNTGTLLSHPFTMTIETETLPQVMEYLCQAAPISYEIIHIQKDVESGLLKPKYIIKAK